MRTQRRWLITIWMVAGFAIFSVAGLRAAQPDGEAIFKQKCAMCHGQDGKGLSAIHTPDFTDPKVQASLTDKQMKETIENGMPGKPMPAFKDKLKQDEIDAVMKFIRSLNSQKKK